MPQPSFHLLHLARVARPLRAGPVVALLLAVILPFWSFPVSAAPDTATVTRSTFQNVDYLDAETARELDLNFPVLVPSYVPAPFSGAPSVSGGGGSYSLYWMVPGAPPTFLNISGVVGGSFPDGSRDDFNNELFINDTVRGVDAIHEVTSTYDDVWWIADGVLYSVQSLNMQGIDSRGLANELIALEPPAQATEPAEEEAPDPTREAPATIDTSLPRNSPTATTQAEATSDADPTAEGGAVPTATAEASTAPPVSDGAAGTPPPEQATETAAVGSSGGVVPDATPLPTAASPVQGIVIPGTPEPSGTPAPGSELPRSTPDASPVAALSDGTGSSLVVSDGTGGAAPPITGSDGTGGTTDLALSPDQP